MRSFAAQAEYSNSKQFRALLNGLEIATSPRSSKTGWSILDHVLPYSPIKPKAFKIWGHIVRCCIGCSLSLRSSYKPKAIIIPHNMHDLQNLHNQFNKTKLVGTWNFQAAHCLNSLLLRNLIASAEPDSMFVCDPIMLLWLPGKTSREAFLINL